MKLRNKITGEVEDVLISAYGISGDVAVSVMDSNFESGYKDLGRYKNLSELNEEWEDYELMEDQDIIKFVKNENAFLRGKITVYEKFLKDKGFIKEEE